MNVFAIERRDEARVDTLVDQMHDRVAVRLDLLDLDRDTRGVRGILKKRAQQSGCATHVHGELPKMVEKRFVF